MPHNRNTRTAQHPRRRTAATAVEFALCAPIFFLLVFAGIEFARANMLIHTVESASLQGARRGIISGATAAQCIQASQEVLKVAKINQFSIFVSPPKITESTEKISVKVSVPLDDNLYFAPKFFKGKTIERTMVINREL